MGFRDPILLLFLILALAPVVIHFLMRLRTKRVGWGANYLLERAIRRARNEKQWLYYLLLALRCLAAALLVLAFSRLFFDDAGGEIEGQGMEQIVVINDGYNLGFGETATTFWDDALVQLELLFSTWPTGTTFSIYGTAGGLEPWIKRGRKGSDRQLSTLWQEHQPRDGVVDLPVALQTIDREQGNAPYQLTIVSPAQANQWPGNEAMAPLASESALWLVIGEIQGWNARLLDLVLPASRALRGDSLRANVLIALSGEAEAGHAVVVEFTTPGQARQRVRVPLQPGQTVSVPFDFILNGEAGQDVVVRADLRDNDALARDNSIERVVRVLDEVSVVLPNAVASTRIFERATDWLTGLNEATATPIALQASVAENEDWSQALPVDALLVIDDRAPANEEEAEALLNWVREGGALIIGGGPGLRPELWPKELLGGNWAGMRLEAPGGTQYQRVETAGFESSAVETLGGAGSDGLRGMKVYGYWEVEPDEGTEVLGMLDNGLPWLMSRRVGKGTVVLLSSGLSGRWNNLPVLPAFPHVYHRLATLALQGAEPPLNLTGEGPFLLEPSEPGRHVLAGPTQRADRATLPLSAVQIEGMDLLQLEAVPAQLGVYSLVAVESPDAPERFVSIDDSRTSGVIDPLPVDQRQALAERLGWTLIESENDLRGYIESGGAGRELYAWLAAALLFFLLAEAGVGRLLTRQS